MILQKKPPTIRVPFDLTFSFQISCGVQLSSLSVRKRYEFHFSARSPNPGEELKLSVSEVLQSQKASKASMEPAKSGLQGSQAWGEVELNIVREANEGIVCYFKAPFILLCFLLLRGVNTTFLPPEGCLWSYM